MILSYGLWHRVLALFVCLRRYTNLEFSLSLRDKHHSRFVWLPLSRILHSLYPLLVTMTLTQRVLTCSVLKESATLSK